MEPHTRAIIAAAVFASITGKKVAGLYDHSEGRDLRIAAEKRGDHIQGFDGERGVKFGGALPELYDAGDKTHVSLEIDGTKVKGYDRGSAGFYAAHVINDVVQVFDYDLDAWFAYDIQDAHSASSYHRNAQAGG